MAEQENAAKVRIINHMNEGRWQTHVPPKKCMTLESRLKPFPDHHDSVRPTPPNDPANRFTKP